MTTPAARTAWLALVCFLGWLAAAAIAPRVGIWVAIGGAALALGAVVLVVDRPAARALLKPTGRCIVLGAAAGALMTVATYLLYPVLTRVLPIIATDSAVLYSAFRAPSPLLASIALVLVILGEELVWRGAVQTELVRRLGPTSGLAAAAAAYALALAPLGSPVLVAVALLCGLAWGSLRALTSSLVPALIAHIVWDVVVLLWRPLDSV